MAKSFFGLSVVALAVGIAVAGVAPARAAPAIVPAPSAVRSDVVEAQVDGKVIRRDRLHRDGRVWKKPHHHRERRNEARHHDGRSDLYRPRATPKYSYDAYGNFRTQDGKRRWRHERRDRDRWEIDDWNGWDRPDGRKKRKDPPRFYRENSSSFMRPSPALREVLTAVPD